MLTNDDLDLARAKAIAANWWVNTEWDSLSGIAQMGFLNMARAIRTADAALGVVSVPLAILKRLEQWPGFAGSEDWVLIREILAASPLREKSDAP